MSILRLQACRICGSRNVRFDRQLPLTSCLLDSGVATFWYCADCGTVMNVPGVPPDYASETDPTCTPHWVRYYVECGCGLLSLGTSAYAMNRLMAERKLGRPVRFLDVGGCFGYVVDMASRAGWDATGVEPSVAGRIGRETLGIHVIRAYLEDADLPKGGFDICFSSEVLEHVPDPGKFLRGLVECVGPEGVIVLTTPNAEVARHGDEVEREWLSCYGPGEHLNIFTPYSAELLLRRGGLRDVRMVFIGGSSGRKHLYIVASPKEGVLPRRIPWFHDEKGIREFVLRYLAQLAAATEKRDRADMVYWGAVYRLCEQYVCAGDYGRAKPYAARMDAHLWEDLGFTESKLMEMNAPDLDRYLDQAPAYLGNYLFARAILALNGEADPAQALSLFRMASHICRLQERIWCGYSGNYAQLSRFHEGVCLSSLGRMEEALAIYQSLARDSKTPESLRLRILAQAGMARVGIDPKGPGRFARRFPFLRTVVRWARSIRLRRS